MQPRSFENEHDVTGYLGLDRTETRMLLSVRGKINVRLQKCAVETPSLHVKHVMMSHLFSQWDKFYRTIITVFLSGEILAKHTLTQ